MRIGTSIDAAAGGMQAASRRLSDHAHAIASLGADGAAPVDLASEIVGTLLAGHAYTANARVLAHAAETERSVLDLLA